MAVGGSLLEDAELWAHSLRWIVDALGGARGATQLGTKL